MENINDEIQNIYESEKYLKDGPQTEITSLVKEISDKLPNDKEEFITEANRWIGSKIKDSGDQKLKNEVFRKRTASQIIEEGFSTGCTDDALVFLSLARAKRIPSIYVEAVNKDSDGREGHVFVESFVNGRWLRVNPARREYQRELDYSDYDIIGKGLDSWDIGTGSIDNLIQKTSLYRT